MDFQKKIRKGVDNGKIRVYFPDQVCKGGLFDRPLSVTGRGFCQSINNKKIGYGINAGYELYHTIDSLERLPLEALYAGVIEKIFGNDLMSQYYASSNLAALVSSLGQHLNYDDALIFIKNVDYIHKSGQRHPLFRSEYQIRESIEASRYFLIRLVSSKIAESRYSRGMSEGEALFRSMEYAALISPNRLTETSSMIDREIKKILELKKSK